MKYSKIYFIVIFFYFNKSLVEAKSNENIANVPRIINGTEADWIGTRHQVSIRLKVRDWFFGGGHICGGSLIAPNIVLSAGHCIWNYDDEVLRSPYEFSIVMGNLNRFILDENTLIFNVTKISMLPTFNATTFIDDIAILFLDGQVAKNFSRAYPIALNVVHNLTDGTKCEVSGWGRMQTGEYPAQLMVVDVALINDTFCRQSYDNYFQNGMICAGYVEGLKDACTGDSGGPLKCGEKLVGIVSFGDDCAQPGFPGIYAKVSHYFQWIQQETGLNGGSKELRPMTLMGIIVFFVLKIFL